MQVAGKICSRVILITVKFKENDVRNYLKVVAGILEYHGHLCKAVVIEEDGQDMSAGDIVVSTGLEDEGSRGTSIVRHERMESMANSTQHVQMIEYVRTVWKYAFMETLGKLLQPVSETAEDTDDEVESKS